MQLGKDLVDLVEVHVLFGLDVPKSLVEKLLHLLSLVFFPHIETFLLEKGIDHIQVCFINTSVEFFVVWLFFGLCIFFGIFIQFIF